MPELGIPRENIGVRLRHRLLQPVPVLHEHVRVPHHPRPRAGDRDRPQDGPARPAGVGGHRRRRRPLDRRQPPHPRAAPQRGPQDPALQQPDLRADQGPVLAHLRDGEGTKSTPYGSIDHAVQPAVASRSARGRRSSRAHRHRTAAHAGGAHARRRAQGRGVRRDLPELQRLQRRRLGKASPRRP